MQFTDSRVESLEKLANSNVIIIPQHPLSFIVCASKEAQYGGMVYVVGPADRGFVRYGMSTDSTEYKVVSFENTDQLGVTALTLSTLDGQEIKFELHQRRKTLPKVGWRYRDHYLLPMTIEDFRNLKKPI